MGDRDFEPTVEYVGQLIHDIGYEDLELREISPPHPPEPDNGDEEPPRQMVVLVHAPAGPNFVVSATEGDRAFQVQSSYALWRELADAISPEQAQKHVPEELRDEIPDDHPVRQTVHPDELEDPEDRLAILAAFELIDDLDDDVRKEITYQLSEIFTNAEVKFVVDSTTEAGGITGFTVFYRTFPYEDSFGIRELNDIIERVRMAAHRGELFLRYAFNLGVDINKTTAGNPENPSTNTGRDPSDLGEAADVFESDD